MLSSLYPYQIVRHLQCPCCMEKDKKLTSLVNSRIKGAAVQLKCIEWLNKWLRVQAAKVHCKLQKLSGRKGMQYLDNFYYLYVLEGECESFAEVDHELHSLPSEIQERPDFTRNSPDSTWVWTTWLQCSRYIWKYWQTNWRSWTKTGETDHLWKFQWMSCCCLLATQPPHLWKVLIMIKFSNYYNIVDCFFCQSWGMSWVELNQKIYHPCIG